MNQSIPADVFSAAALAWANAGWQAASAGQSMVAAMTDATMRSWSSALGAGRQQGRSWYRPPFDHTAVVAAWLAPWQAWTGMVPGLSSSALPIAFAGWSTFNPALNWLPMQSASVAPWIANWSAFASPAAYWPWLTMLSTPAGGATAATLAALPAAMASDYATAYRSESGYAVAQIVWPEAIETLGSATAASAWLQLSLDLALAPFRTARVH